MSIVTSSSEGVYTITFDRPAAFNAMSFEMYDALLDACVLADESDARVVVMRGAGGQAFVAGTDIGELERYVAEHGGPAYERRLEAVLARVEAIRSPVVAAVDGVAAGAGLLLVAAADLCVCTERSRFGAPIARTVGNTLSVRNCERVARHVGERHLKALLYTATMIGGEEARQAGLVNEVVADDDLDARLAVLTQQIATNAPLTLRALKEACRRLQPEAYADDDDIIESCYGSRDFDEGVRAFQEKRSPDWTGS